MCMHIPVLQLTRGSGWYRAHKETKRCEFRADMVNRSVNSAPYNSFCVWSSPCKYCESRTVVPVARLTTCMRMPCVCVLTRAYAPTSRLQQRVHEMSDHVTSAICLRASYVLPGTEKAYGATRFARAQRRLWQSWRAAKG
eukprot:2125141-Rhodomonas_salina.1